MQSVAGLAPSPACWMEYRQDPKNSAVRAWQAPDSARLVHNRRVHHAVCVRVPMGCMCKAAFVDAA